MFLPTIFDYDYSVCPLVVVDLVFGWEPYDLHDLLQNVFCGLDLYDADPAQRITDGRLG